MRKYAGELRVGDIWTERPRHRVCAQLSRHCNRAGSGSDHHKGDRRVCDHRAPAHDGLLSGQPGRGSRGADITRWKTRVKARSRGCGFDDVSGPALSQSTADSPLYDRGFSSLVTPRHRTFMHRIDTDYAE